MQIVNIHQAKTHLSKFLKEVSRGNEIVIGKAGTPIAKLVPIKQSKVIRVGGQLFGKIKIAQNFDELPQEFLKHFTK